MIKNTMQLTVNGEPLALDAPVADVAGLLAHLGVDTSQVAVEHNHRIVPRSCYGTTPLAPGDQIELVEFVGGG